MGAATARDEQRAAPSSDEQQAAIARLSSLGGERRYKDPEVPFLLLEGGEVRLLSYLWLVEQAKGGNVLARRDDLPPEAFISVDHLRSMHRAMGPLRDKVLSRPPRPTRPGVGLTWPS